MMLVTYLGDAPTSWRGVAFEPHLAEEVSCSDMVAKAASNPYFDVSAPNAEANAQNVGGDDLDTLRAMADELGVKIDRRWGVERIQKAIDEALEG